MCVAIDKHTIYRLCMSMNPEHIDGAWASPLFLACKVVRYYQLCAHRSCTNTLA